MCLIFMTKKHCRPAPTLVQKRHAFPCSSSQVRTSSTSSTPCPLTFRSHITSMSLNQSQTFTVSSISIPFLILAAPQHVDITCLCCGGAFDLAKKEPMLLRCGHSICSNCLISAKSAGLREVVCSVCKLGTDLVQKLHCNHSLVDVLKTDSFKEWYASLIQDA